DYLVTVGLLMLSVTLLALLVHSIMNFFACRTAAKIARDLRTNLFDRVVSFSDTEINKFGAASLITRGTNDIQLIQNLCLMAQRMMVYTPIIAIGGIIMVTQTNVSMGWIIALAVAIVVVVMGILIGITMPKFKIMQKLIDRVNLVSREILTGLSVVRAFGKQQYEEDRFTQANTKLLKTQLFTNRAMVLMSPILVLVMNAVAIAIVWIGAQYVDMGTTQVGDLIAFITYSMMIITSFLFLGVIAVVIPRASVASARVDEVIETSLSIEDAIETYDETIGAGEGISISFEDVCFRYEDEERSDKEDKKHRRKKDKPKPADTPLPSYVLENVSFVAPAGQTTAVIGATGSGKSTVVKLIERFNEVTSGSVCIDGVDIRAISQKRLHELIAYVPQSAFLFSGTIKSNISYGNPDADDDRLMRALDIAQATEFVSSEEKGLDAPVSQGGTNVSGGQRQRLAIARALAVDAKAILFDDSFSALDYKTDAALRHELASSLKGKTVIIVAQRIATIMNADNIIVLKEGKVVGSGTHEVLMQSCLEYRDIAYSQLSEEELERGGAR
ncbi:MAG: ABC transporter ATP-binding protein, partial [Eggerthellaceae bacterium]|nr:ABC transporter ATP-binding protein [Eggerthellaceae bacterium]